MDCGEECLNVPVGVAEGDLNNLRTAKAGLSSLFKMDSMVIE